MGIQRIRTIKPEFFVHEELAQLSFACRLTFIGLWTVADREGRLEDRPARLKALLWPYDAVNMEQILAELAGQDFICRYEMDGVRYIHMPTFSRHQRPNHREAPSSYPECPGTHRHARACPGTPGQDEAEREREREGNTDLLRGFDREPQRSSSGTVLRSSERAPNAKRGWRRVPPNEVLTPERLQMGRDVKGLLPSESKHAWGAFMDYEFPREHHDVDATWRNWLRKERPQRTAPTPAPYKRDPAPPSVRGLLANIGRPVPAQEDDPDPPVPSAEQTRAMLYDK